MEEVTVEAVATVLQNHNRSMHGVDLMDRFHGSKFEGEILTLLLRWATIVAHQSGC